MTEQRLVIDRSICSGHGRCYATTPELFTCDDEGYGEVLNHPTSEQAGAAEMAILNCPEEAIQLVKETEDRHD